MKNSSPKYRQKPYKEPIGNSVLDSYTVTEQKNSIETFNNRISQAEKKNK